ncbi:poly(A) RNA polymerase, mitochondrial [Onthophagus taurus]|uniref:poly(A) RNA polymerase, mitochondrial n=1 Tax=Onthophagus taurus TaxID=166361 RepID=UPI000C20E0D2|nr:poly(A) RNA polymerase, mitochondrial isoform X1 [Onthophagus taurus]
MSLFYLTLTMKRLNLFHFFNQFSQRNYILSRVLSQEAIEKKQQFVPFKEKIDERRLEAKRSIVVQVQSSKSHKELYSYCNDFGRIKKMFHYSAGVEPLHFIIVEFMEEGDVNNILSNSTYLEDTQIVPVQSLFLWFKAPVKRNERKKNVKKVDLEVENGTNILVDTVIRERLQSTKSISEQMTLLHDLTKLNDIGTRLRYLAAKQVESALSGLFPNTIAYPFGSSVNGFGKMGCDLDIVLRLLETDNKTEGRLVFHNKASTGSDRFSSQRHMDVIGDLLQLFLPGCAQVRKILQARVPIIKYCQQFADIDCDLSMANMSGFYMSELLYVFGEIDARVRPLVFTIRKWASEVGLTNNYPGRWITNFSLTLMVLAFLQQPQINILPNIKTLIKAARREDEYITEDGINCTFLRDIKLLNFNAANTDNLENLLNKFFEHYAQFDYATKAINLNEGISIHKPDHSPLYIVNPLERGLNVSKNVSPDELEKFKMELRNAAWCLESNERKIPNWGVLSLCNKKKSFNTNAKQVKMIEVSKLFEEEEEEEQVEFKNPQVEKEVNVIRNETKETIKRIDKVLNKKLGR